MVHCWRQLYVQDVEPFRLPLIPQDSECQVGSRSLVIPVMAKFVTGVLRLEPESRIAWSSLQTWDSQPCISVRSRQTAAATLIYTHLITDSSVRPLIYQFCTMKVIPAWLTWLVKRCRLEESWRWVSTSTTNALLVNRLALHMPQSKFNILGDKHSAET